MLLLLLTLHAWSATFLLIHDRDLRQQDAADAAHRARMLRMLLTARDAQINIQGLIKRDVQ